MLRKILTSAMVFLITAGVAFAQSGAVKGTVTDKQSGEAVIGANVFIKSINKGAPTDKNGNFTIPNISYGTYTLSISYVGYETKKISITVDQSTVTVNAELAQSIRGL